MESHFQSFESNPEIYGLNSEMELIGFPSKNLHHPNDQSNSVMWKEFFGKSCCVSSSSKTINEESEFYNQQDFGNKPDYSSLMVIQDHEISGNWNHDERVMLDDQSLRSCVFTNERPSQRLSLSLGSSYPSRNGYDQSFELRQQDESRFDLSSSKHIMQDGVLGKVTNFQIQNQFLIRSSKYLAPSQELLNEFCNLGSKQMDCTSNLKIHKTNQQSHELEHSNSSLQSLYSLDQLELQKRKAKLLQILEEVDRRYNHYCTQMKAVVSSFEAIAGNGTAKIYSALASKAMSRHFRSLRDGIVDHIKATKKALGEKDSVSPGATRGETPKLRILDQTLRQQKSFQQMSLMETHPWRPQRGLPERAVSVLRAWLFEHFLQPYPSDVDKHILARQTGLSRSQVSNWFINARVRLWKPMVEEMYIQETKENENMGCLEGSKSFDNPKEKMEDKKPTHEQLVRIDSECLSSIINNPEKNETRGNSLDQDHGFGRVSDSFGGVELDFSTYNHNYVAGENGGGSAVVGGGSRGVSLTLGLHQHSGGGGGGGGGEEGSLAVSQNSLFHSREHIEDCSHIQYSLLENEGQNLQYRN